MYKKLLKNLAFIFFIIAVLLIIQNFTLLINKEYWFTPESIDECIKNETIIFLYLCVPSILLLIIQLLRKIFKNDIVQKVLKVVNILIIICSALFVLLWEYIAIAVYIDKKEFQEKYNTSYIYTDNINPAKYTML